MAKVKSSLMAMALILTLSACVAPSSMQSTQAAPLRKGDDFALVSPAVAGHPLRAMDAIVVKELSSRTGAAATAGNHWLLEYSYAVRPAAIAMKGDGPVQGFALPQSDAMLQCSDTSHRVTVRIMAKDNGAQVYRGTAELVDCRSDLSLDELVFATLLDQALNNLAVE